MKPQIDGRGKWWRFKYRFGGKEKGLSFGTYSDTSLLQAREKRDVARKQLANGIDPGKNRKAVKSSKAESAENSFEVISREWGYKNNRSKRMFERNIFPWLGSKPITDILPMDILTCLGMLKIEALLKPPIDHCKYAGRFSAMPWQRAEPSEI